MPYKNPQDILKYQRAYKKTEAWRKSVEKFKKSDKRKKYIKQYRESGKARENEIRYEKNHIDRNRIRRIELRKKTLDGMGGKCIKCGFNDYRALQIDHVNGDGIKERKIQSRKSYYPNVLKSFLKGEKRYQILCCNCNWIKRHENKEYRKKPQ